MEIEYHEELPEGLKPAAAELFLHALGDKLTPLLGGGQRARQTLLAGMNPRRCLAAVQDGELVGLLAIHTARGGFIDPSFSQLRSIYGVISSIWRLAGLVALSHQTEDREWHVEGIAVAEAARGRGVGTRLLSWFRELAENSDVDRLTLQVIDTNPRAKKLYKELGYRVVREQKAWPFDWLFGFPFRKVISLERSLSEASAPK